MNADAQKFLSKSGETLTVAMNSFSSAMNTFITKTTEDTMLNAKLYEAVRWVGQTSWGGRLNNQRRRRSRRVQLCCSFIRYLLDKSLTSDLRLEYDAHRVHLEELNLGGRDASKLPKLDQAQQDFQNQRERYQKVRDDLSVKLKLLQDNKVSRCSWGQLSRSTSWSDPVLLSRSRFCSSSCGWCTAPSPPTRCHVTVSCSRACSC